ncbi:hypothetical protein NQ317_008589 [Molorchus minor]|uniref:DDE Tnp4 domain-containing protein n=1 Tax=Molorchus minor TaxID=1323400 RepID=A0ABQ9JJX5_9CUCU|nr:hypothetical protein NQ317_008589 [Molorchus minor]
MDLYNIFDDDEDDVQIYEFIQFGLPRQVYERNNYFNVLDDVAFRKRFRLSKDCVLDVLRLIDNHLEYPYDSNNCISPINQLLTCLRFYSTGGHLQMVADFAGMHVSSVSRIIRRVTEAIARLYDIFICLPENENEIKKTQQNFFEIAGFLENRKAYYSINTQVVCDASLKIMNVVARWPGSSHDATIFNHSAIHAAFERNTYRNCLLLGDSGYPCKSYLLTPLLNPATPSEHRYNESHIRTRNTVERLFGVLKRRFSILAYGSRLKTNTTLSVIVAASVLHNIAIGANDVEAPPLPEELNEHVLEQLIMNGHIPHINPEINEPVGAGRMLRQQFINEYFANL